MKKAKISSVVTTDYVPPYDLENVFRIGGKASKWLGLSGRDNNVSSKRVMIKITTSDVHPDDGPGIVLIKKCFKDSELAYGEPVSYPWFVLIEFDAESIDSQGNIPFEMIDVMDGDEYVKYMARQLMYMDCGV